MQRYYQEKNYNVETYGSMFDLTFPRKWTDKKTKKLNIYLSNVVLSVQESAKDSGEMRLISV